jgi:hypothetical protein
MRWIAGFILILSWCSLAAAGVVNVEFTFTPFIGDPAKNDKVETVPGKARVFINNVIFAEEEIRQQKMMVLFEEREIGPSVWVTTYRIGSRLRKGKNVIRIEFEPTQGRAAYETYFVWASVMDQATKQEEPGRYRVTNQADKGSETKPSVGKVVLEREFMADFATDLPWHHYPPVTSLNGEDKQRIAALILSHVKAFKPDFSGLYRLLQGKEGLKVDEMRKAKCLDKAYRAGIRVAAPTGEQFEFVMTGNPEVVVQRKGGDLFAFENRDLFEKMDDDMQMCAGVALYAAYPPRLTVIRVPSGEWNVAY